MEDEFLKSKSNWEKLGAKEPYWSVLTKDNFLMNKLTNENENKFFNSGIGAVNSIYEVCHKAGITFKKYSCLEFGCGVGRVTFHLAKEFSFVLGVDISKNHIELANKKKSKLKINNIDFLVLKNGLNDIGNRKFDLIFSVIVLQHINKNQVFKIFSKFMEISEQNGIIIFQIPTFHPKYDFEHEKIIEENVLLEMHAIPQKEIVSYFYQGGFKLQGCFEINNCGKDWLSNWFIFQK